MIWILFCLCLKSFAQVEQKAHLSPFDPAIAEEAAMIRENIECFTDRSMYVTEETIRFSASIRCAGNQSGKEWSKILYVELLSADGTEEANGKFPVYNQAATGELAIPAEILSGNYHLRCYTKWMRNFGPETYCYVPVRIINPYRSELSVEKSSVQNRFSLSEQAVKSEPLKFSSPQTSCKKGGAITIDLQYSGVDLPEQVEGCISVVSSEAKPELPMQINRSQKEDLHDFRVNYLPDLNGLIISGTVLQPDDPGQIRNDVTLHFTLFGEKSDYLTAQTDESGRFAVVFPDHEGKMQLLVQPLHSGRNKIELRIDPDFDQQKLSIDNEPFQLSEKERKMATILAQNVQLEKMYQPRDSVQEKPGSPETVPFYGAPEFSLNMDDFVLLPTLNEVFLNLVPVVTPVERNKKSALMIDSNNPLLGMYDPLLMVDGVPVFDLNLFMSVPTNKIKSIDVINDVYLKGDRRFGGIINLHSKEKNIAGIDLPKDAFFMDFMAMQPTIQKTDNFVLSDNRIPDTRNTLLWIPKYKIRKDTPSQISFIAPEYPGEYVLVFRGTDSEGQIISSEITINVE